MSLMYVLHRVRPCNHGVCCVCAQHGGIKKCPVSGCGKDILRVVGIAAPMGAPGMEASQKLPVVLLDMNTITDRREPFVSIVQVGKPAPGRPCYD